VSRTRCGWSEREPRASADDFRRRAPRQETHRTAVPSSRARPGPRARALAGFPRRFPAPMTNPSEARQDRGSPLAAASRWRTRRDGSDGGDGGRRKNSSRLDAKARSNSRGASPGRDSGRRRFGGSRNRRPRGRRALYRGGTKEEANSCLSKPTTVLRAPVLRGSAPMRPESFTPFPGGAPPPRPRTYQGSPLPES